MEKNKEEFIEKARKIHGDKYDYSKVNYINSSTKVCIICPEHGEFWQRPYCHIKGQGCPKCAGTYSMNLNEFNRFSEKSPSFRWGMNRISYIFTMQSYYIKNKKPNIFKVFLFS